MEDIEKTLLEHFRRLSEDKQFTVRETIRFARMAVELGVSENTIRRSLKEIYTNLSKNG